jgi:hypothetical protein
MLCEIHKYVATVDGRSGFWPAEVAEQWNSGCNFLVVLENSEEARSGLAHALEVEPGDLPKPLSRTCLLPLCPYLHPKDFDLLMGALNAEHAIYFIELLDLPTTQPPRVKLYLLYGSVRGIISQHDHLLDAKQACDDYLNQVASWRQRPEASIYKWQGQGWHNLELC